MRRLLAIAAMAAVVLTGAACNKSDTPTTTPTTAAPTSAAANANKAVCDAAHKALTDGMTTLIPQMTSLQDAITKGDKVAQEKAVTDLKAALTAWAASVKVTADSATDPQLKATISEIVTAVEAGASQIKTIDDAKNAQTLLSSPVLANAATKIGQLCPAG